MDSIGHNRLHGIFEECQVLIVRFPFRFTKQTIKTRIGRILAEQFGMVPGFL